MTIWKLIVTTNNFVMSDIQEYIVEMNSLMYGITIKVNWPGHRQTEYGRVKKSLILSIIAEKYGGKKVIMTKENQLWRNK